MRSSFPKHYFFSLSYLCKLTHLFSFHTNLLRHLAPMISIVSLLNELLPMPMTQRCHVLCFTILYLSSTEFPTRFSFFLNKHLNCLWLSYSNFERYLFPAENSLTLDLWNKAIFLSYLSYLSLSLCFIIDVWYRSYTPFYLFVIVNKCLRYVTICVLNYGYGTTSVGSR